MRRALLLSSCLLVGAILAVCAAPPPPPGPPRWFKGNTHTHSFWSDGDDFPEMIVDWYRTRGYHFLGLSDHNVLHEDNSTWLKQATIERRSKDAIARYEARFGKEWVQRKVDKTSDGEVGYVRLRTLAEYRGMFEKPGEFLLINAQEVTDKFAGFPVHINALNIRKVIKPAGGDSVRDVMANNLFAILQQEAGSETQEPTLAHLNHPNFRWGVTAEDMAAVTLERFFEIYNGHPGTGYLGDEIHPPNEKLWDIANALRIARYKTPPLFGVGTDDSHAYHETSIAKSNPGRGWIMVRAAELTPAALLRAMKAGDFYASSGVTLRSITYDENTRAYTIEIEPEPGVDYAVEFVGTTEDADLAGKPRLDAEGKELAVTREYSPDVGRILTSVKGTKATYALTGRELYVRGVVRSSRPHPNPSYEGEKTMAWTQPFGWRSRVK